MLNFHIFMDRLAISMVEHFLRIHKLQSWGNHGITECFGWDDLKDQIFSIFLPLPCPGIQGQLSGQRLNQTFWLCVFLSLPLPLVLCAGWFGISGVMLCFSKN